MALDDLGIEQGTEELKQMVQHVKTHRSLKTIGGIEESQQIWAAMGNRLVDGLAKAGAEEAPGFGRAAVMAKLIGEVKWAIRHIAWWHTTADFPEGMA